MPIKIYPQEYFHTNLNEDSSFKEGLKWGAMLLAIGIILGALIVSLAGGKHAS